jgi:hypothetical protein
MAKESLKLQIEKDIEAGKVAQEKVEHILQELN